jgi:hypothetical protein
MPISENPEMQLHGVNLGIRNPWVCLVSSLVSVSEGHIALLIEELVSSA